jgi:hypothetical protein
MSDPVAVYPHSPATLLYEQLRPSYADATAARLRRSVAKKRTVTTMLMRFVDVLLLVYPGTRAGMVN